MGKKLYEVIVTQPAKVRYQSQILEYLYGNFTFERDTEIDEKILDFTATLNQLPSRGRDEDNLKYLSEKFKFIPGDSAL